MNPAKAEAPTVATVQGFGEQTSADSRNSNSGNPESKAFANVRASLALKGYALLRLHDGSLLIERWGYSRTVDSISQAAQFLTQIGGHHG